MPKSRTQLLIQCPISIAQVGFSLRKQQFYRIVVVSMFNQPSVTARQRFWGSAADRRLVVRVAIGLISHRSVLPRGEPAVGDVFVSSVKGPPATSFGHFGKKYLDLRFFSKYFTHFGKHI